MEYADDTMDGALAGSPSACPVCGHTGGPWEVDHKHPRSRGGLNTKANRWVICRDCNRRKARRTLYEFMAGPMGYSNRNKVKR